MRALWLISTAVLLAQGCSSSTPPEVDAGAPCQEPTRSCGGDCVDVRSDSAHCGACNTACAADEACAGSRCYPTSCGTNLCASGQVCVSNVCADRSCFGITCEANQLCAAGSCLPTSCGATACGSLQVCVSGACVDASCVGVVCPAGASCAQGACLFQTCSNQVKDGTESDVDCGGSCAPCASSQLCGRAADCVSRVCTSGVCAAPSCTDTVKNGTEGDVDCGGSCTPCAVGASCTQGAQCASSSCQQGQCRAPSCTDQVKNGAETDLDCGGGTCPACAAGLACSAPSDCASTQCSMGRCISAACSNSVKDGLETDVDCGGSACSPCASGKGCAVSSDCATGVCGATLKCSNATCTDQVKNAQETDVDCGGGTCPACFPGKACQLAGDCTSRVCNNHLCAAATCTDGALNGAETDVDCGGATCNHCETGKACLVGTDCRSTICTTNRCAPLPLLGTPVALPVGTGPRMVAVGDLDGDGRTDLAVSNYGSFDVSIYFSEPDGGISTGLTAQVSGGTNVRGPSGVAIADFTGDGVADVMVGKAYAWGLGALSGGCIATMLKGVGNRGFLGAVDFNPTASGQEGGCGHRLVAGLFSGDALKDLWLSDHVAGEIYAGPQGAWLLPGTSSGLAPTMPTRFPGAGAFATGVDFDRDGDLDVVTHNHQSGQVLTYRNTGTALVQVATFGVGAGEGDIAAARLNADLFPDIAVASRTANTVGIAFGVGDGNFLAPFSLAVTNPDGVALGDLDGDGNIDVVVGGMGVVVFRGKGDGTFQAAEIFSASLGDVGHLALGDFNGDGKLDVACIAGGGLKILYNTLP